MAGHPYPHTHSYAYPYRDPYAEAHIHTEAYPYRKPGALSHPQPCSHSNPGAVPALPALGRVLLVL